MSALVGVDDGEDFGNRLAEIVAVGYITLVDSPGCLVGNIGSSKVGMEDGGTNIFVSLDAEPPAIFWTRNWPSSVFSSLSCFFRSSLFLVHSAPVLTFPDDCRGVC